MKKNIASILSLLLTICTLIYISVTSQDDIESINFSTASNNSHDLALVVSNPENAFTPELGKSYLGFKEALGFKESQNNYFTVNDYGYLGKYQFGKETLKMIGIYNPTHFLSNPELQEKAFLANAQRNKWILRKDIKRSVGKVINGVTITESGILAAAHLGGPGSVKKYLRSYGADVFEDANGATIQYYMKKFSGYDTSNIKPNRTAKVKQI
ncbi:peptidoglycan-binding protein LysM [Lacinutrix salivirga]